MKGPALKNVAAVAREQRLAGRDMLGVGVLGGDDVALVPASCGRAHRACTGMGWVGEYHSPGTSPLATGFSSTPNTGLPVLRSRMYM